MIRSLYKIGKVFKELPAYQEYFKPYKHPFPRYGQTDKEIEHNIIYFNINQQQLDPSPIIEVFRPDWINKYLFRPAKARATNLVPTFLFHYDVNEDKYKDNIKKVVDRIKASLKNYKHTFLSTEDLKIVSEQLLKLELKKDNRYLLTFKLDGKYFGEYNVYHQLFEKEAYGKYYRNSKGNDHLCAVTYEQSAEVWGRIDTLGFAVTDKSFSRSGFNTKLSYKMFPASPEAVKILEGTKSIVLNQFSHSFYGLKYFVLPHFIIDAPKIIKKATKEFLDKQITPITDDHSNSIIYTEAILHQIIESSTLSTNDIYYDLFFYQPNNAQFLIKIHLSDVLPSRLKHLFDVKKVIEQRYQKITQIIVKPKGKRAGKTIIFYINFGKIKDYFSHKVKTDTIFQPYFFKVLEAVFYSNYLQEKQILVAFFKRIQQAFKNRHEDAFLWKQITKESFTLYQFFLHLNLFKNKSFMESSKPNEHVSLTREQFIEQHPTFFDTAYKKGVFMLGCLTQILLGKQYKKLNSEPFTKQLNSLNIDEKQIQKILPKLINKLREYDTRIMVLEGQIAQYIMHPCTLAKVEISYVFTLGMIMQTEFNKAYKASQQEDQEQTS